MKLSSLELARFRNYRSLRWQPGARVNLLLGANAQGKTNLLEAISLLMRGRSKRIRTKLDIVTHGERECRLSGRFANVQEIGCSMSVTIDASGARLMELDGQRLERTSKLFETLPCVFQECTDLEILTGAPAERRSFLDMLCLELSSRYVALYAKNQKLLKSRNALLASGSRSVALDIVTKQFCTAAAAITRARLEAVSQLVGALDSLPGLQEEETLSVEFLLTGSAGKREQTASEEALSGWYREKLEERAGEDFRMKTTGIGPHRDDLSIRLGARPVRGVASRGQLKDVLLRLRIAEAVAVEQRREEPPVLLLDDAFSETDEERRRRMIGWIPRNAQVFLTGTDPTIVKEFEDRECARYRVRKGALEAGWSA